MEPEIETEQQSTALINVEKLNPLAVFTEKGVDPILAEITKKVQEFVPDISTAKGRKEIASMANKVARSKTLLDDLGKNLVADWKQKAKVVDDSRKKIRDELDELKTRVRAPLTDWETKEQERVVGFKNKIARMEKLAFEAHSHSSSALLRSCLEELSKIVVDESWQEFQAIGQTTWDTANKLLINGLANRVEHERQQEELAHFRKLEAERVAKDAEAKAQAQIAERARVEAEQKAKAQLERAEAEKNAAIEAQKRAEERARMIEENAKQEAEKAARYEQEKIKAEKAKIAEDKRRVAEAQKKRAEKINATAKALVSILEGLELADAETLILAIEKGRVPYLKLDLT